MKQQYIMRLFAFVLTMGLVLPSVAGFGDSEQEKKDASSVSVDLSMFEYTPKAAKKAALLAFLRRNWDVETIEPNRYVGVIDSGSSSTKAEIIIENNTLTIRPMKGFSVKENWLLNLKKDFLVFLVEESY